MSFRVIILSSRMILAWSPTLAGLDLIWCGDDFPALSSSLPPALTPALLCPPS